jgi:hypothetical protein
MRHNKKRNSALLYEFLIRHISNCLINDNKEEAKKAVAISKKYFSSGSPLRKELDLFKSVLDTNVKSKTSAQKILGEVVSAASKMNVRELDTQKSKLIKEINHTFENTNVYDYKIPHYSIYASVHTLLSDKRNKKKILESVDRIKLEDNIVEFLTSDKKNDNVAESLKKNPNYNNAVYRFVVERFHKKYDKKLNENQKKLLTKYAMFLISENKGVMKSSIQKEVENIKGKLRVVKDESLRKDTDVMKRLTECYKKFVTTDFDTVNEETILNLLQYMKLTEEVES